MGKGWKNVEQMISEQGQYIQQYLPSIHQLSPAPLNDETVRIYNITTQEKNPTEGLTNMA